MINGSIYQEDLAILNVHVPNSLKMLEAKKKKLYKEKLTDCNAGV